MIQNIKQLNKMSNKIEKKSYHVSVKLYICDKFRCDKWITWANSIWITKSDKNVAPMQPKNININMIWNTCEKSETNLNGMKWIRNLAFVVLSLMSILISVKDEIYKERLKPFKIWETNEFVELFENWYAFVLSADIFINWMYVIFEIIDHCHWKLKW